MEDDKRSNAGNARVLSQPELARFPSLHSPGSNALSSRRSLPIDNVTVSQYGSETTFAVFDDNVPDYPMSEFERRYLPTNRGSTSIMSPTPSIHSPDLRYSSEICPVYPNTGLMGTQRMLSEGQVYLRDSHRDLAYRRLHTYSDDTLALYPPRGSSLNLPQIAANSSEEQDENSNRFSYESWCICDDSQEIAPEKKRAIGTDLEAQKYVFSSTTSFMPQKAVSGSKKQQENRGGPPGGPPGLPPFPPGFPDELKVTFSGPNDQLNPKNWPSKQKWAATACIASFTFLSPLASSMIAPALGEIQKDFGITNPLETQITLSIFVLAYAIGPMFLAPLSELYGRAVISQSSNVFFLIFNTLCGFAQSKQQLMAFRFLAGLGGSAPLAMGGGVLGDIFKPEERGKAMGLYAMGPLLGPAVGPLVGGWVAEKSTWRWMFWATSIVNVIILVCGFIWFKETYAPYLLHKKAKQLREETGNHELRAPGEEDLHMPAFKKIVRTMARAFKMLFTQPIVQVMAIYMGFSYGILYLMLSTYPLLWRMQYGQSTGISGLNYISLGLGFFIGAPLCGKSSDTVYKKLKARTTAATPKDKPVPPGKPEYRMPVVICFSFFVPIGLLIYGWSAQSHAFWLVPNIGAFIFGIGTIAAFQCVTTYLVDTFARFAASAVAAVTVLRSLMGFAFPIFAPAMYHSLGFGWGNTVLALAAVGIGIPTPIMLWLFGEKLRQRSTLAQQAKKGPPGGIGPQDKGPGGQRKLLTKQ